MVMSHPTVVAIKTYYMANGDETSLTRSYVYCIDYFSTYLEIHGVICITSFASILYPIS
jgi:hypothetical protein